MAKTACMCTICVVSMVAVQKPLRKRRYSLTAVAREGTSGKTNKMNNFIIIIKIIAVNITIAIDHILYLPHLHVIDVCRFAFAIDGHALCICDELLYILEIPFIYTHILYKRIHYITLRGFCRS